jgi:hypothetical protein
MLNDHHATNQTMYITCLFHFLHVLVATDHFLGDHFKTQTVTQL